MLMKQLSLVSMMSKVHDKPTLWDCVGAAFYEASISSQFKVKDIKVQYIMPYDVQVSYIVENLDDVSYSWKN